MHKRSVRFSILVIIMTLFVGFGVSFVAPKPVRADALGDFITRLSLGDFIRSLMSGLFGGTAGDGPYTPTPTPAQCEFGTIASCYTSGCTSCTGAGCATGSFQCTSGPTPTPTTVCPTHAAPKGMAGFVQQMLGQSEGAQGDGDTCTPPCGPVTCPAPNFCVNATTCVSPTPWPCTMDRANCNATCGSNNCEQCGNFWRCRTAPSPSQTPTPTVVSNTCRTDCDTCPAGQACSADPCLLGAFGYKKCVVGGPPTPTPTMRPPVCPVCQEYTLSGMAGWGCHPIANGTACGVTAGNVCTNGACGPYVNECTWSCDDSNCAANQTCEYSTCPLGQKKCVVRPNCGTDPSICTSSYPPKVCVFEDGRFQCVGPSPTPSPIPPTCYDFGTCLDVCGLTNCDGSNCPYERYRCRIPIVSSTPTPTVVRNCGALNCVSPKVCIELSDDVYACVNPTLTPTLIPTSTRVPTPTTGSCPWSNQTQCEIACGRACTGSNCASGTFRCSAAPTFSPTPTPTDTIGCQPYCMTGVNCNGACVANGCTTSGYTRCSLYTPTPTPTDANGCRINCSSSNCSGGTCIADGCQTDYSRCVQNTPTQRPSATGTVRPTATSVPNLSPTVTVGPGTPPPSPFPTNTSVPYPTLPPGPPEATATPSPAYTYVCSSNRHTVRKWSFDGLTNIANLECPANNLCNANDRYLGLSDVMALTTLCINPQQLSPTPTTPSGSTATPTAPPGSTATPTSLPTPTPVPVYESFSAWFGAFKDYLNAPAPAYTLSLTALEDWRNNIPLPEPTP